MNELIQYSLVSDQNSKIDSIKLVNPLLSDCSILRSSLLPDLIKTISENKKQGNIDLEGFEYGHVFFDNIASKYEEKEKISGIFGGATLKVDWSNPSQSLSWFEAKGKLEEVFKKLNVLVYWKNSISKPYQDILHPYRTAELYLLNGKSLGVFGQINPIKANQQTISSQIYLFEINFELLKTVVQNIQLPFYKQYSFYPKIVKDLSFIVHEKFSFAQIHKTVWENGTKFLVHIKLLDEYRGKSIPENHRSLCVQLTFQSNEKTLITKEIEQILNNLYVILTNNYKVIIRN